MSKDDLVKNQLPLYEGRGFPVDALSPDEFERFVFSCLLCIDRTLGIEITAKPTGSGDGGFDVQGQVITSGRTVCVQCKRLESPLGTPTVAEELAKVAAQSFLEGYDVEQHRFICSGGVRTKLRTQLKEKSRAQLAAAAGEKLASTPDGELANLRKRILECGADPRSIAEKYVVQLGVLVAWDMEEFDAALSGRWTDVLEIANRFFRLATSKKDFPLSSGGAASASECHD